MKELSPKDRIVFVCTATMGDELVGYRENGYTKIYNLKGGMDRWQGQLAIR